MSLKAPVKKSTLKKPENSICQNCHKSPNRHFRPYKWIEFLARHTNEWIDTWNGNFRNDLNFWAEIPKKAKWLFKCCLKIPGHGALTAEKQFIFNQPLHENLRNVLWKIKWRQKGEWGTDGNVPNPFPASACLSSAWLQNILTQTPSGDT